MVILYLLQIRMIRQSTFEEKPFNSAFANAMASISTGTLVADQYGVIRLPINSGTADSKAYVTRKTGGICVLFCTWRGKGSNLKGYVCCQPDPILTVPCNIDLTVPRPGLIPTDVTATMSVTVEKKLSPGWYYASYSSD